MTPDRQRYPRSVLSNRGSMTPNAEFTKKFPFCFTRTTLPAYPANEVAELSSL